MARLKDFRNKIQRGDSFEGECMILGGPMPDGIICSAAKQRASHIFSSRGLHSSLLVC
jgi:hypothetical protein